MQRKGIVWTPEQEPEYDNKGKFGTYNPTDAVFVDEIRMLYRFAINTLTEKGQPLDFSEIGLAVSTDGLIGMEFQREGIALAKGGSPKEALGVEDPRAQWMCEEGLYLLTYTAVEKKEGTQWFTHVGLATTPDFRTFERKGYLPNEINGRNVISDKDVVAFDRRINNRYWLIRRPDFGDRKPGVIYSENLDMFLVSSTDLFSGYSTGKRIPICNQISWCEWRVGAGTQPFPLEMKIDGKQAWLELFHGVEKTSQIHEDGMPFGLYRMGGMIFIEGSDGPEAKFISKRPLLEPEEDYETGEDGNGLVPNVVFPTGLVVVDGIAKIYYGAGDGVIALAEEKLEDLVSEIIRNSL